MAITVSDVTRKLYTCSDGKSFESEQTAKNHELFLGVLTVVTKWCDCSPPDDAAGYTHADMVRIVVENRVALAALLRDF